MVTFQVDGYDDQFIKTYLGQQNINVTVSKCSSTRLDMEKRGLESVVRASIHYFNTSEEIDRFCDVITSL